MSKHVLQPPNPQDNDADAGIEPKTAHLTLIQLMALILFLYGVLIKDTVSIWISIGLALSQERKPTIKNFLMLIREKTLPNNSKRSKTD